MTPGQTGRVTKPNPGDPDGAGVPVAQQTQQCRAQLERQTRRRAAEFLIALFKRGAGHEPAMKQMQSNARRPWSDEERAIVAKHPNYLAAQRALLSAGFRRSVGGIRRMVKIAASARSR